MVFKKYLVASYHQSHDLFFLLFFGVCLLHHAGRCQAQQAAATLDPSEALAVNAIFRQWGISVGANTWNISGEICSGTAIDATGVEDADVNPALKCDCSFFNRTRCRVSQLKVYALDAQGVIPDELANLTYLDHLNINQNFLSGPLPAFVGNFTRLQTLTLGTNAFSGPIPREIGNLRNLIVLSFGTNNFSGPLPEELGNLANLQQLYIDSAGVSGEIPITFSSLINLQTVWASDNSFTGRIPEFIGQWTSMRDLRFQGNSFEGPIPDSISNMTSLTNLRISDIINGSSSSLDFIRNLNSLSTLVLRNNRISSTIPSNIGGYQSLQTLDLSFNNLTGRIPDSLFNLTRLEFLFLGNNNLTGSIPARKSNQLVSIDLSYNNLSGIIPEWASDEGVELNIVANNFDMTSSNSSILSSGLNCIQRNFPCNTNPPRYSSFAIKCGGRSMTSSTRITYEDDGDALGPASYFVRDTERWAVSNAGRFADNSNESFIASTASQFINTLDTELFQTARISPGSLRYYGLGLENGNYTVNLQFAEIQIENTRSHRSLGRRIFDVYLQGSRVLTDFNIKREADGISFSAVSRTFPVNVTDNFLEIHLFWAGKGTCCMPRQGTYGPSISAISVTPNFTPTVSNQPPGGGSSSSGLAVGLGVGFGVAGLILVLAAFIWIKKKKRKTEDDEEILGLSSQANTFSYSELRTATDDFNPSSKLGEGGFGPVYKGTLADGRDVAVKQLSVTSHQGKSQFVTEIATISAVQHRNLVKLYGCCIEADKRLLVYEYLENKSLDQALFAKSDLFLDWPTRYDVCLGTARGLAYLHEESRLRIVHRDVKASNILLDADLTPKISDFGLAKLYDDKKTHISTRVAGTIGYLAPEYAMRGHLTEKADVFGFGVVALEILSGRPNADTNLEPEKVYLLEWAWYLYENDRILELVDPTLTDYDKEEALRVIRVAMLCIQASPMLRPQMSRVVAMLSGDIEAGSVTSKPGYLTDWQLNELSSFMSSSTSGTSAATNTNSRSYEPSSEIQSGNSPFATQPMLQEIIGEGR